MQQAMLYEKLPHSRVRCGTCQWRCNIAPGKFGVCRVYQNRDGVLYNLNYAKASSVAADPIEKKPLFHFFPNTLAFSIGGWGCNFHCQDCQNWEISCPVDNEPWLGNNEVLPQAAVELALRYRCQGIAWTYNEPSIWFEYTLDSAKLAKDSGLYTAYVTNGFLTPEALDTIGPYLDAWRVDVKGFSDALYQKLARINRWRGILEVAQRAKDKWKMHVEVVTNIIPTNMQDLPPTPIATLEHAAEIGEKAGLKFVYTGNVPGHSRENTVCYSCGKTVIKRLGYQTELVGLDGSKCGFCGATLNIVTSAERSSK